MKEKIIKQAAMCIVLAAALFVSEHSGIGVLEKGSDRVVGYMSVNYTAADIYNFAQEGIEAVSGLPEKAKKAVAAAAVKNRYGEPVDEEYSNGRKTVYAVGAGQIAAVGENEEIGRYVRITHEGSGESLYGNLSEIFVKAAESVRKGQIIGIYSENNDEEFYYSFKEFD